MKKKAVVYAVCNQKGGVAKTTSAQNIGAAFNQFGGKKVLLIDLDQQSNLTIATGADRSKASAAELLTGKAKPKQVIQSIREGLDIIVGSDKLGASNEWMAKTGKEYRLREMLEPVLTDYDVIVCDTSPSLGVLSVNALTLADKVIIPAAADLFSLEAIKELGETLDGVKKYTNPGLEIAGVLLTRYQPRSILTQDFTDCIQDAAAELKTKVFAARIPEGIAVKEAQAMKQDIFTYAPKSKPAQAYHALYSELIGGKKNGK